MDPFRDISLDLAASSVVNRMSTPVEVNGTYVGEKMVFGFNHGDLLAKILTYAYITKDSSSFKNGLILDCLPLYMLKVEMKFSQWVLHVCT